MLMYLVRNAALYREDDAYAAMDRTVRLWREFGLKVRRVKLRAKPTELLREATGLELEDLLAMGFAAWANEHVWSPEHPLVLSRNFGAMPEDRVELFLSTVAASPEEYRITLRGSDSQFDFLAFEQKPIVELENGLLVLDGRLLWQRFTSGLYWLVHDHEKFTRGSEGDRHLWTQGYGEMVEEMAKDQIRATAPTLLGAKREKGFYDDEDFKRAYGKGVSRPDAAVDLGHHLLLFEVQSGQLSSGTRVQGDPKSFERDTERLVLKKCRQLDSAARAVLANPQALIDAALHPGMRVLPFVVVGGGYPGEAVSGGCVEDLLVREGLLDLDGVGKLGILRIAELEILEGLFEGGEDVTALLVEWKASGLRNVSLWSFLASKFSDHWHFRPARMEPRVEAVFDDLESRLRPRSEPNAQARSIDQARLPSFVSEHENLSSYSRRGSDRPTRIKPRLHSPSRRLMTLALPLGAENQSSRADTQQKVGRGWNNIYPSRGSSSGSNRSDIGRYQANYVWTKPVAKAPICSTF